MSDFNENTHGFVTLDFLDQDGVAVNPDSAKYTLYDEDSGDVINSRNQTPITGPTSGMDLVLTPADNVLADTTKSEERHRLFIEFTYTSGANQYDGSEEVRFTVENKNKA